MSDGQRPPTRKSMMYVSPEQWEAMSRRLVAQEDAIRFLIYAGKKVLFYMKLDEMTPTDTSDARSLLRCAIREAGKQQPGMQQPGMQEVSNPATEEDKR